MLMLNSTAQHQRGVTLVELVIAIVIITIAATALLTSLGFQSQRNVDPVIQVQSQLLARQYLDEVLSKPFFDPAADPRLDPTINRTQVVASVADQSRAGAPARLAWNNLGEYANYNNQPILDATGNAIASLGGYRVSIDVNSSAGLSLGGLTNSAVANCPAQIAEITVTIVDARGQSTSLSGYRASYWQAPASWGC